MTEAPPPEDNRNDNGRRGDDRGVPSDRRQEAQSAADVLGWDGVDRRQKDRRDKQERRREERLEQETVWATNLIDDFFPMDDQAQNAHDKRQEERRAKERREEERRQTQSSADEVDGWDGADRREDDRRDIERRELERRIRASQIADKGENPGV